MNLRWWLNNMNPRPKNIYTINPFHQQRFTAPSGALGGYVEQHNARLAGMEHNFLWSWMCWMRMIKMYLLLNVHVSTILVLRLPMLIRPMQHQVLCGLCNCVWCLILLLPTFRVVLGIVLGERMYFEAIWSNGDQAILYWKSFFIVGSIVHCHIK